jgi:hypothetical protein
MDFHCIKDEYMSIFTVSMPGHGINIFHPSNVGHNELHKSGLGSRIVLKNITWGVSSMIWVV